MDGDVDRLALGAFGASAVLAGGNAVGVRFSNRELDPLWGAGLRFLLAALVLLALAALLRKALPRGRAVTGAGIYGALNFGASYAFFYWGLTKVNAGFGQTILALVPLATLLLAVAQGQERLRAAGVVGALLALAGVAVMSQGPLRDSVPVTAVLALVGSSLCIAQAALVVRRFPPVHPVAMNAVGMLVGSLMLIAAAAVSGEAIVLPDRAATWAAVAYLVPVGSVLVFVLYLFVLGRWTASRTAYGFVLTPLVTIVLSAWLDDEPLGVGLLIGGALVLTGVYVGALRGAPSHAPPPVRA